VPRRAAVSARVKLQHQQKKFGKVTWKNRKVTEAKIASKIRQKFKDPEYAERWKAAIARGQDHQWYQNVCAALEINRKIRRSRYAEL
jgi:hypothetical protein